MIIYDNNHYLHIYIKKLIYHYDKSKNKLKHNKMHKKSEGATILQMCFKKCTKKSSINLKG